MEADDGDMIGLSTAGFLPWRLEEGRGELVVTAKGAAARPCAFSSLALFPGSALVALCLVESNTPAPDA